METFTNLNQLLEKRTNANQSATFENNLQRWSEPPSKTEIEKCERAERMIKEAISSDEKLSRMKVKVFAKGSYANRTNIPSDSDVDIGVINQNQYFNKYPDGKTKEDFNFIDSSYHFEEYFLDVAKAIENKFGKTEVTIADKCIKIRSNTCRVDADVVPHFVRRLYNQSGTYREGVSIKTSGGNFIYNWPDQDYSNGVAKNERTARGYKKLVRILKSVRSEMENEGIASAQKAKSFLVSCLAYNVPDIYFEKETYTEILVGSLDYLINMTADNNNVDKWTEVNEVKYLFHSSQPWKLEEVHGFLKDAKKFVGKYK